MTAPQSLKFAKLKRRLGIPHWQAVGLLESVWLFTQVNAPAGDIGRFSDEDIAIGIEWSGDSSVLVTGLVETGWIDRCEANRLIIHDWEDHCPTYLKGAMVKNGKHFAKINEQLPITAKQKTKVAEQSASMGPADCPQPASTLPADCPQPAPSLVLSGVVLAGQSKPHQPPPVPGAGSGVVPKPKRRKNPDSEPDPPLFAEFWTAYPRKENRSTAVKAFVDLNPSPELHAQIIAAVARQRTSGCLESRLAADGRSVVPHASSWLNGRRWEDEPLATIVAVTPRRTDPATNSAPLANDLVARIRANDQTGQVSEISA